MTCQEVQRVLLEPGCTAAHRRETAAALAHLESCPACRQAMDDYARIHDLMNSGDPAAEPHGGWTAFENRMLATVAPKRSTWLPATLRLAAAFLLGLILAHLYGVRPAAQPATPSNPSNATVATVAQSSPAPFTPQEVSQHARAFDAVSEAFDRRASWVLLANNTSDVGLADSDSPVHAARLLLLRLTMTSGNQTISSSDLMILPGQTASLTVPLADGRSLHYEIGTSTGEPTHLSLWAELQTAHGGEAVGALATQLRLQPGQKTSAGELVTTSGAYRLKIGFSQANLQRSDS